MKMKKFVATIAMAGAITAGTAGVAFAADNSGSGAGPGQPAATARRHPWLRIAVRRHAGKVVSDTLGVSRQDLRTALKGGQSVNEYAQSLGKDPQGVKDALVRGVDQAVDKAVANGRIDQARADQIKANAPARIDRALDHHFGQDGTA